MSGFKKHTNKVQMDLLKVLIAEGNINKAVGLTRQMMTHHSQRNCATWQKKTVESTQVSVKTTLKQFKNVYELKKATDMQDTNLIFAVNCKELSNNGEPSYVLRHQSTVLKQLTKWILQR